MSFIKRRVAMLQFVLCAHTSAASRRRWMVGLGLGLLANGAIGSIAQAQLAVGSVLNLSSRSTDNPGRRVTIELADSNRLVYRSGQFGVASTATGSQINLGALDRRVTILPSSSSFAQAYADVTTSVGDLPLDSAGGFQGDIPKFIQNISLKTADGNRQLVSFTLKSVNFNPQTNSGEVTGLFVDEAGKAYPATGEFSLDPTTGCKCAYAMKLEVLPGAAVGPPESPAAPGGGGGGGGGGFWPLAAFAALPAFLADSSDNSSAPPTNSPPEAIPTPALLPATIGLLWKVRRRRSASQE